MGLVVITSKSIFLFLWLTNFEFHAFDLFLTASDNQSSCKTPKPFASLRCYFLWPGIELPRVTMLFVWFQTRTLLCETCHLAGILFPQKPLLLCFFSNFSSGGLFLLTFLWKNGAPLPYTLLSCSIFFLVSLELLNVMLHICLLTIHFPY